MIDFESGDPITLHGLGGQLHFTVVHDVADEGVSATRVGITDLFDVVEVLMTAAAAVNHRTAVAAELARCGRDHELNKPQQGRTPWRTQLLVDRLVMAEGTLRTTRESLFALLEHDRAWAEREAAAS